MSNGRMVSSPNATKSHNNRGTLRLVGSVEVVVGLVPVTRRRHGLATTVAAGIPLGISLSRHARATKVAALLIPASASRRGTYSKPSAGYQHNVNEAGY